MALEIQTLSILGFVLSGYAFYVRSRALASRAYKPLCDLHPQVSCTRAFTSTYGSTAGLPNPVYGVIFYVVLYAAVVSGFWRMAAYLSVLAVVASLYLAYLSYARQRNFCLVCTSVYFINALLLYFSWQFL